MLHVVLGLRFGLSLYIVNKDGLFLFYSSTKGHPEVDEGGKAKDTSNKDKKESVISKTLRGIIKGLQ